MAFRCKLAAPGLSTGGTWQQALSSCESVSRQNTRRYTPLSHRNSAGCTGHTEKQHGSSLSWNAEKQIAHNATCLRVTCYTALPRRLHWTECVQSSREESPPRSGH